MFPDFGSLELLLILVVTLLVIGPEKLPDTLRELGLWFGRLSRSFNSVKSEIEKEIGMDDVRRQLHNEAVMQEMKRIEDEVKGAIDPADQPQSIDPALDNSIDKDQSSTPRPTSEAELEAEHASKVKPSSSNGA
jgi:sec-independent protein translocase protein TatB